MCKWEYNIKTGLTDLWKKEDGTIFVDKDKEH
jgi:hypothetical protein